MLPGTPVSSPGSDDGQRASDEASSDEGEGQLLPPQKFQTVVYDNEAETSFTCSNTPGQQANASYSNVVRAQPARRTSGAKQLANRYFLKIKGLFFRF